MALAILSVIFAAQAQDWNYEDDSHDWDAYPECMTGKEQSPINIDWPTSVYESESWINTASKPIVIQASNGSDLTVQLVFNGKTLMATPNGENNITMTGGPLPEGDIFQLAQFHLHWGNTSEIGSEDSFNSRFFPVELHFVFWNTNMGDYDTASKQKGGLSVVGIMGETAEQATAEGGLLEDFLMDDVLFSVELDEAIETYMPIEGDESGTPYTFRDFDVGDLIVRGNYATYPGSLTTPPCSQVVTWIVEKQPILLAEKALEKLRTAFTLTTNHRPPQPLNGRVITFSRDCKNRQGDACTVQENSVGRRLLFGSAGGCKCTDL